MSKSPSNPRLPHCAHCGEKIRTEEPRLRMRGLVFHLPCAVYTPRRARSTAS